MKFDGAIQEVKENKGEVCNTILRSLPEWFGIEQAIVDYVRAVELLPTFIAQVRGQVAGFVSLEFHNQYTSEIHVMGVCEEYHRHGIGRALVTHSENYSREKGAEYLMVKTLGPSRKNTEYDRTREFYLSVGFRPLQEFKTIWDEHNPCLILVKRL
jgi:GNAT superfamily N-acetyltransferase